MSGDSAGISTSADKKSLNEDNSALLVCLQRIRLRLYSPGMAETPEMPEYSIFAVVLAAGESSRFGSAKQLAEYDGESLVTRAVRLAEDVCGDRSVLVVGSDWKRVLAACDPLRGFFVCNDNYKSGMASSIVCGVNSVAQSADAMLLMMADQPLISAEHLNSLISEWRGTPNDIVISEYAGVQGPPVVFPAQCFDGLMKLEGDQGARSLLSDAKLSIRSITYDAAAIDIDTPEDLAMLVRNRG